MRRPLASAGKIVAAGLALAALPFVARGLAPVPLAERNRRLIGEAFEAWREHRGNIFDLLADDAEWTIAGTSVAAGTHRGREDFLAKVIRPFNARLSKPLTPTVKALYADGDTVVAHWDGEAMANDGLAYRNTYAWFMQIRDGKIVKATAFFDSLEFDAFWKRVQPKA